MLVNEGACSIVLQILTPVKIEKIFADHLISPTHRTDRQPTDIISKNRFEFEEAIEEYTTRKLMNLPLYPVPDQRRDAERQLTGTSTQQPPRMIP